MRTSTSNTEFDTIVIGGGISGTCIAWFLAQDGVSALCLDDGRAAGSTANAGSLHVQMQSRLMRQFPERLDDFTRTLSLYPRAVNYWAEIAAGLPTDIEFDISGGVMIADNPQQLEQLRQKIACERQNGVETELLNRRELHQLMPYLNPQVQGGAWCAMEGKVNPLLANAAIRSEALRAGARFADGVSANRVQYVNPGYEVTNGDSCYRCGRVVIAAGAGSGAVAASLGLKLPTVAEPLHMNITEPAEPFLKHLLQHSERPITLKQMRTGQLLIGGGWPANAGAGNRPPGVRLDSMVGNLGLARELVPGIHMLRVQRSWAGVNPTVDLLSVLGEVESLPGLFITVPGDAGYTLAPYCARLIVDSMCGRQPDYSLQHFSPTRF